jgi:hypothetical protein
MFRKSNRHIILYALLSALILAGDWSCRKDVKTFRDYPASLADLDPLFAQVPNPASQSIFVLSGIVPDTVLITPGGVRVFLTDTEHLFANASATPVPCSTCQTFKVEVTEVLHRGDMIARALPAVTTDGKVVESQAMVRVNIWCNGQPLDVLPGRNIKIQVPVTQQQSGLTTFEGQVSQDSLTGWQDTGDEVYFADWQSPLTGQTVSGYEIIAKHAGWIDCGRTIQDPVSSFCIDMPSGFSALNTRAFIVFKNINAVVALTYNADSQKFCFANAPKGYLVKLVTVSKLGNLYWLGQKETEIGTNATLDLAPQQLDEQAILDKIKSL